MTTSTMNPVPGCWTTCGQTSKCFDPRLNPLDLRSTRRSQLVPLPRTIFCNSEYRRQPCQKQHPANSPHQGSRYLVIRDRLSRRMTKFRMIPMAIAALANRTSFGRVTKMIPATSRPPMNGQLRVNDHLDISGMANQITHNTIPARINIGQIGRVFPNMIAVPPAPANNNAIISSAVRRGSFMA